MKFVLLKSRGGDYLVVVQNVAWLRPDEMSDQSAGWSEETRSSVAKHRRRRGDSGGLNQRGYGLGRRLQRVQ